MTMTYTLQEDVATLAFDDGKANVVGHTFLDEFNSGLDRAEAEAKAIILRGREGMFSGGFDLGEFKKGPEQALAMVSRGFDLLVRLYGHPLPIVCACTGHGIAMGAFLVMASDSRIGVQGDYKYSLPETAIGMDLPPVLMELTRSRISPAHLTRVAIQSEVYNPEQAVVAGFIDEVVSADELDARAVEIANRLKALPQKYYAANKLATRAQVLAIMKANTDEMRVEPG